MQVIAIAAEIWKSMVTVGQGPSTCEHMRSCEFLIAHEMLAVEWTLTQSLCLWLLRPPQSQYSEYKYFVHHIIYIMIYNAYCIDLTTHLPHHVSFIHAITYLSSIQSCSFAVWRRGLLPPLDMSQLSRSCYAFWQMCATSCRYVFGCSFSLWIMTDDVPPGSKT